jgi:YgiT-type zinc finger domain-containing protein
MGERKTDLPFKVGDHSIVIIKNLPVYQCLHCNEYLMPDAVMARVEGILAAADQDAELEILRFAA